MSSSSGELLNDNIDAQIANAELRLAADAVALTYDLEVEQVSAETQQPSRRRQHSAWGRERPARCARLGQESSQPEHTAANPAATSGAAAADCHCCTVMDKHRASTRDNEER